MQTVGLKLHNPHPAQKQVLDCDKRFIVMMAGRRFGKSLISQTISIETAVNKKRVAYITPTYQLGKIFFKEIVDLLPLEIYSKNESDLVITFITGGSIRFFTGERLDNLRGLKFHLAVIDEASFIPNLEDGWLNSIRPTLTDYKGKAIFLSTPKGKNYFFSLFSKAEPDWQSFKFTTYDNPYIDPNEIDDARRQLPEVVFEQEYMANPAENAANPFGSQHIRKCLHPVTTMPVVAYGIDLAKSVDWTVIVGLDEEGNVAYFDRFQMDWHNTKQTILRLPKCPILVDSTGVGDPILEDLQREGVMIQGLKFTSSSKQQLMEGLQAAIHQCKIGYPEGIISQELEVFEYQYTATGVKYSAPSGFHDDAVMALALAWQNFSLKRGTGRYAFL
ncbi:Terminase-like family [uncultured Caudovirales phage]|uniref:Terminase-like family n=1 Tax=uncultured Caudovirales phage TaxID=2100421 RepID=A0A6J5N2U0_9CAUD|nr:Terminase-like family [uncultured Caudovirales phage]